MVLDKSLHFKLDVRIAFPYIRNSMQWLMGGFTLVAIAVVLRRVLRMDDGRDAHVGRFGSLRGDLQAIYQPVAQEIETHSIILGITLNDAFSERRSNRHQMAWRVVALATVEWERLGKVVAGLQSILSRFLPATNGIVPVRRVAVGHFKSRAVMDNVGLYELLDQILFSSKSRFALQLRLLLRASTALSKDFKRACREGELTLDSSDALWTQLDYCFHDFDLIAKETLLAFHALLACQTPEGAQALASELQLLLEQGMRVSVSPLNQ